MPETSTKAETFEDIFVRLRDEWMEAEEKYLRFRGLAASERRKRDRLARKLQTIDPRRLR